MMPNSRLRWNEVLGPEYTSIYTLSSIRQIDCSPRAPSDDGVTSLDPWNGYTHIHKSLTGALGYIFCKKSPQPLCVAVAVCTRQHWCVNGWNVVGHWVALLTWPTGGVFSYIQSWQIRQKNTLTSSFCGWNVWRSLYKYMCIVWCRYVSDIWVQISKYIFKGWTSYILYARLLYVQLTENWPFHWGKEIFIFLFPNICIDSVASAHIFFFRNFVCSQCTWKQLCAQNFIAHLLVYIRVVQVYLWHWCRSTLNHHADHCAVWTDTRKPPPNHPV